MPFLLLAAQGRRGWAKKIGEIDGGIDTMWGPQDS